MLLSICIPTRNRASFLRTTIEAWNRELAVAGLSAEIVVGDNASTDTTPQVLAEAAEASGVPVRFESHTDNLGMTRNLNSVFARARGEYLWIWGDDDLPVDGSLVAVAAGIREYSPEVVLLNTDNIESLDDENRRYLVTARNRLRATSETPVWARTPGDIETAFRNLHDWLYLTNLLSAVIVRRQTFMARLAESRTLLGDENVYQFQHPVLMLGATAGRVLVITRSVCLHRKNTTSWSGSIDASIPCFLDSARVIAALGSTYSPPLLRGYSRRMARQCLQLMGNARASGMSWSNENECAFIGAYGGTRLGGISVRTWLGLLDKLPIANWRHALDVSKRVDRLLKALGC